MRSGAHSTPSRAAAISGADADDIPGAQRGRSTGAGVAGRLKQADASVLIGGFGSEFISRRPGGKVKVRVYFKQFSFSLNRAAELALLLFARIVSLDGRVVVPPSS